MTGTARINGGAELIHLALNFTYGKIKYKVKSSFVR